MLNHLLRVYLAAAIIAVLALAVAIAVQVRDTADAAVNCHHISGPFHTRGARVYSATGARYIPYGLNVVGIGHALDSTTAERDMAVIDAAAHGWCANTVRLQVNQDQLVTSSGHINRAFLSALQGEVAHAESLGLMVAINDQAQNDGVPWETMPTFRSRVLWDSMTYHYGHDPRVIFDLFNEPSLGKLHVRDSWAFWRNGGRALGRVYWGMESLAKRIRARGGHNLLWIEGAHTGGSLAGVGSHRLRHVFPLMYAEHRPPTPRTAPSWNHTFGYLAARGIAPVVDGEWTNYARAGAPWACWDNAPVTVPRWHNYLTRMGIGEIATKMSKGQLIESPNLDDPTRIKSNWSCTDGLDQGAGHQIMVWFQRRNG